MSQTKAVIALVIAVLIACLFFFVKGQSKEIKALEATTTQQASTIKQQNAAIELDKGSDQITDDVTARNATEGRKIEEEALRTSQKIQEREAAVKKKYEKLLADAEARARQEPFVEPVPKSEVEVLKEQRAHEISATRIVSLWEEYCTTEKVPECKVLSATSH